MGQYRMLIQIIHTHVVVKRCIIVKIAPYDPFPTFPQLQLAMSYETI